MTEGGFAGALWFAPLFCLVAALYATVGHGGASGYLAVMALLATAPGVMRPTALVLNILVAAIATLQFGWAGYVRWRVLGPLLSGSVPLAYLGARLQLDTHLYKRILAAILLFAALRMLGIGVKTDPLEPAPPSSNLPWPMALTTGSAIGLLSGLTGVGGGIFLSPLLVELGWTQVRATAGLTAPFILINSIAGLLGWLSQQQPLPVQTWLWGPAALLGGVIGALYGSRRGSNLILRRLLAAVLVIASAKLAWG
jgi:uncharacterized protein